MSITEKLLHAASDSAYQAASPVVNRALASGAAVGAAPGIAEAAGMVEPGLTFSEWASVMGIVFSVVGICKLIFDGYLSWAKSRLERRLLERQLNGD